MSEIPSPFHSGELEVQRRAGVAAEARRVGRIIATRIPPSIDKTLADQRLAVAASLDAEGRVWASPLFGPAGFMSVVDDELLFVDARHDVRDPLYANLARRPELGLLVIDPRTRLRVRLNGRGLTDPQSGLFLQVHQVFGNCTKYITQRRLLAEDGERGGPATDPSGSSRLSLEQQRRIAAADTFFIASFHPEGGADASHRGGNPGFVQVLSDTRLAFADYPGNNMFNTLGNVQAYPWVGLLFLNFETGGVLQLAGRARVSWDAEKVGALRGAHGRVVHVEVVQALEWRHASAPRFSFGELSRANP